MDLTPRTIVAQLDKYIVGQRQAKRAVAVALRNRTRRRRLPAPAAEEITPKNILMIGPTGVGKTEIARRMARLVQAPFIKIEATKFTEVGYVGRDVDAIVRDLAETAVRMVKAEKAELVKDEAREMAERRLLDVLVPPLPTTRSQRNPFEVIFGGRADNEGEDHRDRDADEEQSGPEERRRRHREERARMRQRLAAGDMEGDLVEIEVEDSSPSMMELFTGQGTEELGINLRDMFGGMMPTRKKKRRVSVAEARRLLAAEEAQKLIDHDQAVAEAVQRVEQDGIVFLDEIDKIAGRDGGSGPDVSREGVQRDLLPLVEGSTVMTKYGPVSTEHMLFVAAGAFHVSKPADLIPELQGRFPIRVELEPLTRADLRRILSEPEHALTKQYSALLATDGVDLEFTDDGLDAIAEVAEQVNQRLENIGARRLHTVMEHLLEEVLFEAPDGDRRVVVDRDYVHAKLADLAADQDLGKYIL